MPRLQIPETTDSDVELMERLLKQGQIQHKFAQRVQVVLNRARGKSTGDIAEFFGIDPVTVSRYVKRFNEGGVHALLTDKTRKPGKSPVSTEVKNEITRIVCQEKPKNATHWSTRELAKRVGISHNAVSQILRERDLKPHQVKRFQLQ